MRAPRPRRATTCSGSSTTCCVGELQHDVPVELQAVEPFAVDAHLRARSMPAVAQRFDHDRCVRRSGSRRAPACRLAAHRCACVTGRGRPAAWRITEHLAFEPALPASRDLAAVHHREQPRDAVSALRAQFGDASMEEVLGGQPVAQGAVECGGERGRVGRRGDVDEGARGRQHGKSESGLAVERNGMLSDVCTTWPTRCTNRPRGTMKWNGGRSTNPSNTFNAAAMCRGRSNTAGRCCGASGEGG